MTYADNENYYIREDALQMLLAGSGMRRWYGPCRLEKKEVKVEDAYRILAWLYQENYATWEEKDIVILEPVRSLIKIIHEAKSCFYMENMKTSTKKLCYLYQDKVAVLEYGRQDADKIRFYITEENNFIASFWECGIFPEEETGQKIEEDICFAEEDTQEMAVFKVLDKYNGCECRKIIIKEYGIETYLVEVAELKEKKYLYEKDTCSSILKEMLHMEA